MRNAMHKFRKINILRSTKKPSLFKLGFLVDHSHNMPVLRSILIFIDKLY